MAPRSRNWLWTLNNYQKISDSAVYTGLDVVNSRLRELFTHDVLGVRYITYGKEVGEEGTPHLQGLICFREAKSSRQLQAIFTKELQADVRIGDNKVDKMMQYCQKDGDFEEFGTAPMSYRQRAFAGGAGQEDKWARIVKLSKKGKLEKFALEYPSEFHRYYGNTMRIMKDFQKMPPALDDVCGVWVFGPSGCGKSHYARDLYPDCYDKACNKWWDNYQEERYVLIDDFDLNHHVLAHHLKRWADKFPFSGEIKGGQMNLRPEVICVTSQYSIKDIWSKEAETFEAINRRFKSIKFISHAEFVELD